MRLESARDEAMAAPEIQQQLLLLVTTTSTSTPVRLMVLQNGAEQ